MHSKYWGKRKVEALEITEPGQYRDLAPGRWVRYQGLEFWETQRQTWAAGNVLFAAGEVAGAAAPGATVYVWIEQAGSAPTILVMRPDELAALVKVGSAALWGWARNLFDERDTDHA